MTILNTVNSVGGNIKSISPTKAVIELRSGITKDAVIQAIQKAGYNVVNGTL